MKNRAARKDQAISHLAYIQTEYADEIGKAIVCTRIYEPRTVRCRKSDCGTTESKVIALDVVSAVKGTEGKVAVLDFASFKNPGGGYIGGSLAQEESLCAESTLYPVLLAFEDTFYIPNRSNNRRGLYTDRSMYVPGISLIRNEEFFGRVDVIVAAAPNRRAALEAGCGEDECTEALNSRIDSVMSIASDNGVDTLIAGAFGCGVFGNDPVQVAETFKKWTDSHPGAIKTVVYAIPDENSSNYKAFAETFKAEKE